MIGQKNIRAQLLDSYKNNKLQKSIIIEAPVGMGKETLVRWFSAELGVDCRFYPTTVDGVREAIEDSNETFIPYFCCFKGLELSNSVVSQNAILKFLEEPPSNITIFLLCEDSTLLLPTIQNRCALYRLERYNKEELLSFNKDELAVEIFQTPLELLNVKDIDLKELLKTTELIVNKLDKAVISNALKLSEYVKFKDSSGKYNKNDGYDIDVFISALKYSFVMEYKKDNSGRIFEIYKCFINALKNLKSNKKYVMDSFIIQNYMENKGWSLKS